MVGFWPFLQAQDVSFIARRDFSTGISTQPSGVVVGDWNQDGNTDLGVAIGAGAPVIAVLLGSGEGTFGAPSNFNAGGFNPVSIAAADFNRDGRRDLVVANSLSNNIAILLGNGDGTFQQPRTAAVGQLPLAVSIGEFNGDENRDVAVANSESNSISVLLGNGNGTLREGSSLVVGRQPRSVTVGDFNADSKQDLVVANTASVAPLLGDGTRRLSGAFCHPGGTRPQFRGNRRPGS